MGQVFIEVRDLRKRYGDLWALGGISFDIRPGEVLSILGPNGAGKTTAVEIILGLRKKTSGKLVYFGREMDEPTKDVRRRMGATLQQEEFLTELTPVEILGLFRDLYGSSVDIDELIEIFDMGEFKRRRYGKLSGGQRRRVALAVSVVGDPDVIFLDEPTTGLDPYARRRLWGYIRKLKREGRAVVLTTHYLDEAQVLSDRVIMLKEGKIVMEGSPAEIIRRAGLPIVAVINGREYTFKDAQELASALAEIGDVYQLELRMPTLEDVFLRMVGGE